MEVILQRLLMEEDWRDVVDAAADCLLPLILAHQAAFQQLGKPGPPQLACLPHTLLLEVACFSSQPASVRTGHILSLFPAHRLAFHVVDDVMKSRGQRDLIQGRGPQESI